MNRTVYNPLPRLTRSQSPSDEGVYVNLRSLTELEFHQRGYSFLPSQPVHSLLAGRRASRLRGRGLNFEEIRRYVAGDDIRNMDWHATARLREPQVRVFTEERDRPCLLVVDQRASMFFGSQRAMKSVAAAEAASLAAWRVLQGKDRVGAIVFNDQRTQEFKPRQSRQSVLEILKSITAMNREMSVNSPAVNSQQLNNVLQQAARIAKHDYLVILITDGHGADPKSRQLCDQISEHNDLLVTFIYDPLEASLPATGKLVCSDGSGQITIDTRKSELRTQFAQGFQKRLEQLQELARRRSMPLLTVSAAEETLPQLRRQLGGATPRAKR